jgi:phage terminase small subunit
MGRFVAKSAPVRPLGKCPAHLPIPEQHIWKELVRCSQPGVLQRSDRFFLELCRRMRAPDSKNSEINTLAKILSKLGMTPEDRSKLDLQVPITSATKSEEDKAWDALDELG